MKIRYIYIKLKNRKKQLYEMFFIEQRDSIETIIKEFLNINPDLTEKDIKEVIIGF